MYFIYWTYRDLYCFQKSMLSKIESFKDENHPNEVAKYTNNVKYMESQSGQYEVNK